MSTNIVGATNVKKYDE